jgi:DNA-binding response OmpR family regulator
MGLLHKVLHIEWHHHFVKACSMFKRLFGSDKKDSAALDAVVLVMSDDPATESLICDILSTAGCQAYCTSTLEGVVSILNEVEMPDLIIGDFVNPEVDGKEFLKRVEIRLGKSTLPPVVFLMDSKEDETTARDVGATELVTKPLDPTDFITRIGKIITDRKTPVKVNGSGK